MNPNSNASRILCYGDSNTNGAIPGDGGRFQTDKRWPGALQILLGNNYEVIEEGMGGRTTNMDDPKEQARNGKTYLAPCLWTHNPIDIIILMLGTNDMKQRYARQPEEIGRGMEELIEIIKTESECDHGQIKVLIISPPLIDETTPQAQEKYIGASQKSQQLGKIYEQISLKYGCEFLDSALIVKPSSVDGYHLDAPAHQDLASAVADKIRAVAINNSPPIH